MVFRQQSMEFSIIREEVPQDGDWEKQLKTSCISNYHGSRNNKIKDNKSWGTL